MEIWNKIPNYPNYEVSNMGNVRNVITGNALKPFDRRKYGPIQTRGYLSVHLCNGGNARYKNLTVHQLVMLAFVGERPNGYVINHLNNIRWDNRLENLEYCTQSHNCKWEFIKGRRSLSGEKNTRSKLKEKQVLEIIELYKSGKHTYKSIAKIYGIHMCGVSNIFNGHCWSYLTGIKNKHEKK